MLIERWKSKVKGTFRWIICLWKRSLKSFKFWHIVYQTIFLKYWNSSARLWRHHLKIGSKKFTSVYQVQLAVKIWSKSGTVINVVQKFFSDGGISEFWNIDPRCDVIIQKLELWGQKLHLRYVFQLLEIAEGFNH